jgi:hypothetical protein
MKRIVIVLAIAGCFWSRSFSAPSTISVVVDKNYARTHAIKLNDQNVPDSRVMNALSRLIEKEGRDAPIVILMPSELTFADWQDLRGLIGKVGFLNDRYFVYSSRTQKMVEIDNPHYAIDFTTSPPPRSVRDER